MAFDKYETLTCDGCGRVFVGRRPAENAPAFCSTCLADELVPVTEENDLPFDENEEFDDGKGDDDEDEID